jgi:general stress protein 26
VNEGKSQSRSRLQRDKLDYKDTKEKVVQFLEKKHAIVLATSLEDRVTARTVSFANDGLDIFFMSWGHHHKCEQIRGNPKVALCRDNVQIEGVAEILGSPLDEKNVKYADRLRDKYPDDYERFADQSGMVIVKVVPTAVTIFGKGEDGFYLDCLDLEHQTMRRRGMTD